VQGYCVRCKQKQEMLSATRTLMKNGRRAMIGTCACCGTQMYVAGIWEGDSAPSAPSVGADAAGSPSLPPRADVIPSG